MKTELTEQQLQEVKAWRPDWFLKIKPNTWYKKKWNDGDIDIFKTKHVSLNIYTLDDYFRNGYMLEKDDYIYNSNELLNDNRYILTEATKEEIASVSRNDSDIHADIQELKDKYTDYNFTIIAEKR